MSAPVSGHKRRLESEHPAEKPSGRAARIVLLPLTAAVLSGLLACGEPARTAAGDAAGGDSPDAPSATSEVPAESAGTPENHDTGAQAADAPNGDSVSPGCPAPDGSSGRVLYFERLQPDCIDPSAGYVAVFDTTEGEMRFVLHAADVPVTVNNFVTLARWGYYDGTLLFRTDPSIDIIQGGSPHTDSASDPGPGYTIPDEPPFGIDPATGWLKGPYRYQPGQLVMARSSGADSADAQFFLTTGPNASLLDGQGTYVVFGTTDAPGLAVAQSIIGLHVDSGPLGGAPSREVTVRSVIILETPAG